MLATVACVLLVSSCNKSTDSTSTTEDTAVVEENEMEEEVVADAPAEVIELTLHGGDDMKYDLTTLKVNAGQTVKLTLTHSGKLPKASMGHNFVLLQDGVDDAAFATKALAAKDTDYIPAGSESEIIAHTDLVGGGESSTIEFTAPERGAYTYICTFPGHASMMKGKLIVQ